MLQRKTIKLSLWLPLLCLSTTTLALPNDREQPINIESDSAEHSINNGEEKTIYQGKVVMVQGTMELKGEKIIVFSNDRTVSKVVASGKLASFSQQPEQESPPIHAEAQTIVYTLSNDTIVMTDDAKLTQGGSSITGTRIDYNTVTAEVKAGEAPKPESASEPTSRVSMVLEPQKKDTPEPDENTEAAEKLAAPQDQSANDAPAIQPVKPSQPATKDNNADTNSQ